MFAIVARGGVEVFLNAPEPARAEYPALAARDIGGSLTLFIHVTGIRQAYERLKDRVNVVMPLEKKWYGVDGVRVHGSGRLRDHVRRAGAREPA